jgi:hypothetical protein
LVREELVEEEGVEEIVLLLVYLDLMEELIQEEVVEVIEMFILQVLAVAVL